MPDFTPADLLAAYYGSEGFPPGEANPNALSLGKVLTAAGRKFSDLVEPPYQGGPDPRSGFMAGLTPPVPQSVVNLGGMAAGAVALPGDVQAGRVEADLSNPEYTRRAFDLASIMIGAPGGAGGVGSGVRSQLGEVPSFTERMDALKDAAFQRAQKGTATGDYGLGTVRRTEPPPPKGSMEDASDRLMSSLRDTQRQLQEYKNPPAKPLLAPGESDISFFSGGNKKAGAGLALNRQQTEARIRQLEYDRDLVRKRGEDVTGENYASVRNELKNLRQSLREPTTEMTPVGEQYVLPGAERASEATMAQRAADAPLKAEVLQKPPGGMFSDEGNQGSLFSGGNKRAGTLLALARGDEGAGPITGMGGIYRPPPIVQTVDNPVRNAVPGIYGDPRDIAAQALGQVAPQHPALKQLFGVDRRDLYDIAMSRKGNVDPYTLLPGWKEGATGSYAAEAVMNPRNAQRLQDILGESMKIPELREGMVPWYVMDPAYQNLVKQFGPDVAKEVYTPGNILTSMASPGSPVDKELIRGTSASMMANLGRFDEFAKYGGMQGKRGAPPEMAEVPGHIYHRTSQVKPMQHYVDTGEIGLQSPKVPLYIGASGIPETGFQTGLPIPDVHFTGGLGMFDVRKGKGFRSSMVMPEFQQAGPWYAENVAKPAGLEPVYAQALQWGALGPQTGVDTLIGAGKLELLAKSVWERAQRLGVDPHELLNRVLARQAHAAVPIAGAAGAAAAAMQQDNQ